MRFELAIAVALVAPSCSDNKDGAPAKGDPAITFVPTDGGVSSTTVVAGTGVDPSSLSLDDVDTHRPVQPQTQPLPGRDRRAIDVTLRSSPPGARVAVDGTSVGVTPAFWSGYADGRQHEFVFTLPRHAIARYRFVPVSSGVIHARLDPIAVPRGDAGIAPPPEVVPNPPTSAVVPPAPPPTIVRPTDAAVPVTPPAPASAPTPAPAPAPAPAGSAPSPAGENPFAGPQP